MRRPLLFALATCNALQGSTRPPTRLQSSQRPPTLLRARPDDCPEEVWERIVEAERNSREKKGQIGAALWGLDKGAIEQNQLRIWEELRERQESGAKPTKKRPEEPAPSNNPFAGVMKAFKDVYDEADAMGYAQAVALNKQLEDKGVLSKAKRRDDDDDVQIPQERVVFEEPVRKTVKRKRGKGAKPKSRKGAGFS